MEKNDLEKYKLELPRHRPRYLYETQSRPRYQVAGMRWKKMTWKNTNSNYRGIDRGIYEDLFTPRYQGGVILKNN
ncbi:Uncharacterised protein [Legionella israelensis]|uniref:Uncharacterized protein n=1 Tax=Legionella israelensis TaxID=454 RepID=A0A0W0VR51_9GAMM|nr:hypothetical protein Lisr_1495 [Legionella israelensis]SCY17027.1 hypothetical protein SAMN02746069_01513 [Legionella israelensis DSM 19235]STX60485.1 Uncharacterised protein [Legionella israelensis]